MANIEYHWYQKPWGWTKPLYLSFDFELWTAHCLAGGYSSRHFHDLKYNTIYSRDATLLITKWTCRKGTDGSSESDLVESLCMLRPGRAVTLSPGVEHRFEVIESGRIYETYFGRCFPQDIVRRDANGWRPPATDAAGLSVRVSPYDLGR